MGTYYLKGGSKFAEVNPKVWTFISLAGYDDSKYGNLNWKDIDYDFGGSGDAVDNGDPFWRLGGANGGETVAEIGLWNDYRIKISSASGIQGWHQASGDWFTLFGGAGAGATTLAELTDVVITGTPADNEVLAYDSSSSKWINQTAAEANLATADHTHAFDEIENPSGDKEFNFANKHLHLKWVAPASGAHEGAFEVEASGAFSGDLMHIHQHTGVVGVGTYMMRIVCEHANAHCLHLTHGGDDLDFGTGGLLIGADARITEFDTGALDTSDTKAPTNNTVKEYVDNAVHTEDHDNTHHTTDYEVEFSKNTAFNKDFGTLGTEVCVGNDSRLSDARTPTSHNNTYHSTDYHSEVDGTGSATVHSDIDTTGSGDIITTDERNALHAIYTLEAHVHDNDTLQINAINSNGGAFSFTTTGTITMAQGTLSLGVDNSTQGFLNVYGAGSGSEGGEIRLHGANTYNTIWYLDRYQNSLRFIYGASPAMTLTNTTLTLTTSLAMGGSKITGLAAATTSGDAVRYEQLHAQSHDNTDHSTNYEPTISPKNSAFNKEFGTLGTEVCVGNDSRLSDARTPTTHDHEGDNLKFDTITSNGSPFYINTTTKFSLAKGFNVLATDVTGQIRINANLDVVAATEGTGSLIIGDDEGDHIAIDGNEIMSKATGTTTGNLYIQYEGGNIFTNAEIDIGANGILFDGNLGSDHTYSGTVVDNITNGVVFGLAVYISSANTVTACDKDSINLCLGISVGTGKVLISGTIRDNTWDWSSYIGKPIFVGDNGVLTAIISGYTTGDLVQCVGIAMDNDSIVVKDIGWVEVV